MAEARIHMAHGGGGRLSRELIQREILSRFGEGPLRALPDGATLEAPDRALVFTTDSFVVHPLEFPGGNIGHLAVHGTVNDLAVCGAAPKWLSLALILEEGLSLALLGRVLDAVRDAVDRCGVQVVTGDTKVVARGQCDGLYINTAGVGEMIPGFDLGPEHIREGDQVLVSGTIGDHGFAVMGARESIGIENGPVSDSGPVHRLTAALGEQAGSARFMRDPTRGGVAAVLNEIVEDRPLDVELDEASLPVSPGAHAVSEMLGLDPLNVACEGRVLLICTPDRADAILEAWRGFAEGEGAARIGCVKAGSGRVTMETLMGGRRLVDTPRGELLPRIC